jgi:CRISPR-associated protein Csy1
MSDAQLAEIQRRLAAGDPAGARGVADALLQSGALATMHRAIALWLRARAHEALKDTLAAVADLEAAVALTPGDARIWNELGVLSTMSNRADRAAAAFQQAVTIDPNSARAWNNLGNSLRSTSRPAEAAAAFERAIAIKPDYALALANLGSARQDLGENAAAQTALEKALAMDPKLPAALLALGSLSRHLGNLDKAVALFARAAQSDRKDPKPCLQLAYTLAERDDVPMARQVYAEARQRDPTQMRALFGAHLTLPMVPESAAAVAVARAEFDAGLAALDSALPEVARLQPEAAMLDGLPWSNFLLAYQGEDDRALQMHYARVVGAAIDAVAPQWRTPLAPRPRAGRKIRVGFASYFFRDGTAGRYFEHWITDLDPNEFEVVLYHMHPGTDALFDRLARRADVVRRCPRWAPSKIAPLVRSDDLDALIYTELGMEATTFALAALRLAPLQCAAWGHPVTTGQPTIDVFFSSDAMEPADGDAHYSERLVRLPGIGTRYAQPCPPGDATRSRFGLPDDALLLLCPQSLFKIHPDNDALFARVLAGVAHSRLVVFEGRHPALTAKYLARLDGALAREGLAREGRVHVLAQCSHDDYLRVNEVCDLMLDTLHWSGGNTSLDALTCGLPLVTVPGRYMRGRQSTGMLRLMGLEELVARDSDDYVRLALSLGADRERLASLRACILAARGRLFDDPAPVAALSAFLRANVPA